ncbi:MAG: ribonuclease III [Thermomicrobiales bacterium]|nr:ribonuclease III [Thermomicrobiales bacterium]MCO5221503.1 ribonuclease III [Thermomicrobiales bacterium]
MSTDAATPTKKPRRRSSRKAQTNVTRFLRDMDIQARDVELFRTALTHRSAAGERWRSPADGPSASSNERLEFYGDAVLGAVVAEYLYHRYPDATEGTLTRRRSALVRAEQLTAWARELKLQNYLYLAQSERIAEGGKERLLAAAFEAIVGAMVIDQGVDFVVQFIRQLLDRDADRVVAGVKFANPKGQLQEMTQNRHQSAPTYEIISLEGPAHQRTFTVEVRFLDIPLATGVGASKRAAEEQAAAEALKLIRAQGPAMLDRMVSSQPPESVGE